MTKPKGDFDIRSLGNSPNDDNADLWELSLDYVDAGEMPPAKHSRLTDIERSKLVRFLRTQVKAYDTRRRTANLVHARRLNNREFTNSVRDVLQIEDVGTHHPTTNLIGDSRHHGFDTHGDTLGFSSFHLEQYVESVRLILDATILDGDQPESNRYEVASTQILAEHTRQNTNRRERRGLSEGFDFLDPAQAAYFENFKTVPETGWYRITIRCTGKDRGRYDANKTGIYDDDPIRLSVRIGDRVQTFALPDEEPIEIQLKEWMAAGSRLRLHYPTDGLRMRGNGNFKFQNAITGEYLKEHDKSLYKTILANRKVTKSGVLRAPDAWHNWVEYWRGPRPRIYHAVVEGPIFDSWPSKRQTALLGDDPAAEHAEELLRPIAERAWRRPVRDGELNRIVRMVQTSAEEVGDVAALTEGIVAILVSPQFLFLNREELTDEERFASKVSYFLASTIPDTELLDAVRDGHLDSFDGIRATLRNRFERTKGEPFLREFPTAWLHLNDINFMAPDPDRFRHYHRKRVSEDMKDEVLRFFRHNVENNLPVTELISADYSFINADLAEIYGVDSHPQSSKFVKHTFTDERRGGLLGMGAFLTVTADSLGTSPIHRAVYVMENFLGMHPSPPPPDVKIEEPDTRTAKTIKQVLKAHQSDPSCAACHQSIDPYGYAFENFDPTGAWRDSYLAQEAGSKNDSIRRRRQSATIPIDSAASFRNGEQYDDITEFRELMNSELNQRRFVRCFITKLLTYANGRAPDNYSEIDAIVARSKQYDYRAIETISAVIDSPLFREKQ